MISFILLLDLTADSVSPHHHHFVSLFIQHVAFPVWHVPVKVSAVRYCPILAVQSSISLLLIVLVVTHEFQASFELENSLSILESSIKLAPVSSFGFDQCSFSRE